MKPVAPAMPTRVTAGSAARSAVASGTARDAPTICIGKNTYTRTCRQKSMNRRCIIVPDAPMKARRQSVILELIDREPLHSQEQLRRLLHRQGLKATQATISRDIKDLGLVKRAGDGAYQRPGADDASPADGARRARTRRRRIPAQGRSRPAARRRAHRRRAVAAAGGGDRSRQAPRSRRHHRRRRHHPGHRPQRPAGRRARQAARGYAGL